MEKLDNRAEAEFKIALAKYYQCYFETFASLNWIRRNMYRNVSSLKTVKLMSNFKIMKNLAKSFYMHHSKNV